MASRLRVSLATCEQVRQHDVAGESALRFVGGYYSHSIRKGPLLTDAIVAAATP